MGYSPWGHKELDTAERLHFPFTFYNDKKELAMGSSRENAIQAEERENARLPQRNRLIWFLQFFLGLTYVLIFSMTIAYDTGISQMMVH